MNALNACEVPTTPRAARLLIVEDEAIVALHMQRALDEAGHEVVAMAGTGPEGVRLAGDLRPDLALFDLRLAADTDGLAAAREIHERFGVPSLLVTAHPELFREGATTFAIGCIAKPFTSERLRGAVEGALALLAGHQSGKPVPDGVELRDPRTSGREAKRSNLDDGPLALAEGATRFRLIFEASSSGIAIVDLSGRVVETNPALNKMAGARSSDPRRLLEGFRSAQSGLPLVQELAGLLSGDVLHLRREVAFERDDGRHGWGLASASLATGTHAEPRFAVVMIEDISDRRALEEQLARQALYDPLTQLPNRALFHDRLAFRLEECRRSAAPSAVLLLDLDHFKDVNDRFGHQTGDALLEAAARRIAGVVRSEDTLARLGGDEFALVQSRGGREAAEATARRLLATLATPIVVDGHPIQTSASIGIALHPEHAADARDLLRCADIALYHAKALGRGRSELYVPELGERERNRREIEEELAVGIAAGELVLHYQPQLDLDSGRLVAVEALVRWFHPRHGLMMPADFIGVAEATGLIVPLGAWVLDEAAGQMARWRADGLDIAIAVNLSPAQLRSPELPRLLADTLERHGIAPGQLELEVTETLSIGDDGAEMLNCAARIANMGIGLAIDDFGIGHSSLAQLKRLHVRTIKIDRSFVADLPGSEISLAVVAAVVALGRALGNRIVAEGVETPQQLDELRAVGVRQVQGFLIARPQTANQIAPLLRGEHGSPSAQA